MEISTGATPCVFAKSAEASGNKGVAGVLVARKSEKSVQLVENKELARRSERTAEVLSFERDAHCCEKEWGEEVKIESRRLAERGCETEPCEMVASKRAHVSTITSN
jgi:hypothetical protein